MRARLAAIFRRKKLDDELVTHLELATDEFIQQGLSPGEARRRALINLGGIEQSLVGRLKPGSTLQRAQAEADILGDRISGENRRRNPLHPKLTALSEHVSGEVRPALLILACAVGVVMLIVCANLSNLMLARTAARQKEMAIRSALGAGRTRLIRKLLTESALLTTGGAALGVLLAFGATAGIARLTAFKLPLLSSVQMDARALGFTVLIAMATGLTLGLAPAWQVSVLRLNASLGGRGTAGNQEHAWLRGTLVVSEIAFACVLLIGAGLLVRSLMNVLDVQLGFRPKSAAILRIDPGAQSSTDERKVQSRIVLRTLSLAGLGMLVGVAASWGLVRSISGLLYGIAAVDPLTFAGTALILTIIAAVAGYLPARRASRVDPTICLRAE